MSYSNKIQNFNENNESEFKYKNISKHLKETVPIVDPECYNKCKLSDQNKNAIDKKNFNEIIIEKYENTFDSDLKILVKGTNLKKYNLHKNSLSERFYHLDLINYRLVATTKEFGKHEKCCELLLNLKKINFN